MQVNIGNNIVATGTAKEMADLMARMGVQNLASTKAVVSPAPTIAATPGMGPGYTLHSATKGRAKSPVVTTHQCTLSTKQDLVDNYADILAKKPVTIQMDPKSKSFKSFQDSARKHLKNLFPGRKFQLCPIQDANRQDVATVIFAA